MFVWAFQFVFPVACLFHLLSCSLHKIYNAGRARWIFLISLESSCLFPREEAPWERQQNAYQIRNHYFCPSEVQNKGQQVIWRKVDRILSLLFVCRCDRKIQTEKDRETFIQTLQKHSTAYRINMRWTNCTNALYCSASNPLQIIQGQLKVNMQMINTSELWPCVLLAHFTRMFF